METGLDAGSILQMILPILIMLVIFTVPGVILIIVFARKRKLRSRMPIDNPQEK